MRHTVSFFTILVFTGLVITCAAFKRGISLSDSERVIIQEDYPNGFHLVNVKPSVPAKGTEYLTHIYSVLYDYYQLGARLDSAKTKPAPQDAVFGNLNEMLQEFRVAGLVPCTIKNYIMEDLLILLKNDLPLILQTDLELPLGLVDNQIQKGRLVLLTGYQGFNPDDPSRCQLLYFGYVRQNLPYNQLKETADEVIFIVPEYRRLEIVDDILIQYHDLWKRDLSYDLKRIKPKK